MPVERIVTVWCPHWPVVAAGVPDGEPAVVLADQRVVAASPAARAVGVEIGDRRRAAQRRCPELPVLDHDPDRDARVFEPIVRAVADLAPRLDVVEPGTICLPARGPSRYFGGDEALAGLLVRTVAEAGADARVGVADGRFASMLAARRAEPHLVVPPGGSPAFLAPLPVRWLSTAGEVDAALVDVFERLGLARLGDLAGLGRGGLFARFGSVGRHAHRLATGSDARPVVGVALPPERWFDTSFPEPVDQMPTVVFAAKRLADRLVADLAGEGTVCTRLVVVAETEHGERTERSWYRPVGFSAGAIVERVRWQLDGWVGHPSGPTSGVVLIRLIPDEVSRDDGVEVGLWGGRSGADDAAGRAIVRLSGLAGADAVRVPEWVGGRLPAERYRWVPAVEVDPDDTGRLARSGGPWPGVLPPPSPVVVAGAAAELSDAQGAPVRVSGRGELLSVPAALTVDGRRHRVIAWAGPWPVEQRWWRADQSRRLARLQVVTDDGTAHLVGVERQRWSVLATYG